MPPHTAPKTDGLDGRPLAFHKIFMRKTDFICCKIKKSITFVCYCLWGVLHV